MDTPSDSQRKAWARLSTFTSFVSRICFFKARRSDSDSVNGCIVIPPAIDFTRVRSGGVKKILSTYLTLLRRLSVSAYWLLGFTSSQTGADRSRETVPLQGNR